MLFNLLTLWMRGSLRIDFWTSRIVIIKTMDLDATQALDLDEYDETEEEEQEVKKDRKQVKRYLED